MKFLVLIRRCGGHPQFNVIARRACDVTDIFIWRCDVMGHDEDPPGHLWCVEFDGEEETRELGWEPRFIEAEMLVAEIERMHKVCDRWRMQYKDDEA